ncbi:hypothetical protein ACHAW6_005668 [Cyclotella cf. meneghiniana]
MDILHEYSGYKFFMKLDIVCNTLLSILMNIVRSSVLSSLHSGNINT